ncbi:MAG TPA: hypothetical protein PLF13_05200 [candidate division Zixibacteria bacterium]|nr:hypothetical protein [candidate division Zixibacteria bacterium]
MPLLKNKATIYIKGAAMKQYLTRTALLIVSLFLIIGSAQAAVPQLITYQGRLTGTDGQPVADATYSVDFAIFSTATIGFTSPLWSETQSVNTTNGLFTVLLGAVNPMDPSIFNGDVRYLSLIVEGGAQSDPRIPMVSVPYAMNAGNVSGSDEVVCHDCDTVFINAVGPEEFTAAADTALKVTNSGPDALAGIVARLDGQTADTVSTIVAGATNSSSGITRAGLFKSESSGDGAVYGMQATARSTGTTWTVYGAYGRASHTGSGTTHGGCFETDLEGTGDHIGVLGLGQGQSNSATFGLYAASINYGTGKSHGGFFSANGGANRYGVYAAGYTTTASDSAFGSYNTSMSGGSAPAIGTYGRATNYVSGTAIGGQFRADGESHSAKYGLQSYSSGSGQATAIYGMSETSGDFDAYGAWTFSSNSSTGDATGGFFVGSAYDGTGYGGRFQGDSYSGEVYGIRAIGAPRTGSSNAYGVYGWTMDGLAGTFTGNSYTAYFENTLLYGTPYGIYSLVDGTETSSSGFALYSRIQHAGSGTSYAGYFLSDSTGTGSSYGVRAVGLSKGTATVYGAACVAANRSTASAYAGFFEVYNLGTGDRYAIYAKSPNVGYAGYFNGDVRITGDQSVLGSKSAAVEIAPGDFRLMYSQESPECWFEDFGESRLVNGRAHIDLEDLYRQTVNTGETYHVFLTPHDEPVVLAVANRTTTSFEVVGPAGSNISFSYRIVAKRQGYESVRLAHMKGDTPDVVAAKVAADEQARLLDEQTAAASLEDQPERRAKILSEPAQPSQE